MGVEPQGEREAGGGHWWVLSAVLGGLVILYVFFFGPLVALIALTWSDLGSELQEGIGTVFRPHIWLAGKLDWYDRYLDWWWELGGER